MDNVSLLFIKNRGKAHFLRLPADPADEDAVLVPKIRPAGCTGSRSFLLSSHTCCPFCHIADKTLRAVLCD